MSDHDHYLAGPCEGISIHRNGRSVTIKNTKANPPCETVHNFEDEERASAFIWRKREEIYADHDGVSA